MNNNCAARVGGGGASEDDQKPKFSVDTVKSFTFFHDRFKKCEVAHVQHPEFKYNYVKHQGYFPDKETGAWRGSSYSLMPLKAWPCYVDRLEELNDYMVELAKSEGKYFRKFKLLFEDEMENIIKAQKYAVAAQVASIIHNDSCSSPSSSNPSMHKAN